MFSIFKKALENNLIAPTQTSVIFGYDDYYDEEEDCEIKQQKNRIFSTEIILHYKDGGELILPTSSFIKIVSIPKYDYKTIGYYNSINAVDVKFVQEGYHYAILLETNDIFEEDDLESIELFQSRTEGVLRITLTREPIKLFDEIQGAVDTDGGRFFRQTIWIAKDKQMELVDEQ